MGSNLARNSADQFEPSSERVVPWRSMWRPILKAAVLGSTVWAALGSLPAYAEALTEWGYDVQTRSLNLTLPPAVTPRVSVIAPDQLLLELPNTQVGEVMSQTVEDGVVDSVVLQQATPETVWVTVEFAEGTVLSEAQYARPLAEAENGDQQWQVRPALVSASRGQTPDSVSVPTLAAAPATTAESSASSLRTESDAIAQSSNQPPDFSADLPILEPAMPIDEPVSVPPLNSSAPLPTPEPAISSPSVATDEPTEVPVAEIPDLEPSAEAAELSDLSPVFDVEVIPAEPTQPTLQRPSPPIANEPASDSGNEPASASLPESPPFIGEIDESMADMPDVQIEATPEVVVPAIVAAPSVEALPAPDPAPVAAVEPDLPEPEAVQETAGEPITSEQIASGSVSAPESPTSEPVEATPEPVIVESVQPANVNRWPEPIPFGQPLPD
ncbi:MAG: hypothetical protein AAFN40_18235 [Cyanobacteria bacterium J06560_6]